MLPTDTNSNSLDERALGSDYPLRILIVEDNKLNLRVLKEILLRMGYLPDVAYNGLEAVEWVSKKEFDLIFMDLRMPIMNGLEATRKIKDLLGENCPWVVAFTANSHYTDRLSCQNVGMDAFVEKPTTPKQIQAVIKCVINKNPKGFEII